jgi:hypothetical protein
VVSGGWERRTNEKKFGGCEWHQAELQLPIKNSAQLINKYVSVCARKSGSKAAASTRACSPPALSYHYTPIKRAPPPESFDIPKSSLDIKEQPHDPTCFFVWVRLKQFE